MNNIKPITPEEVVLKKEKDIPDGIFEAFNEMIAGNFNGFESTFTLKDVSKHAHRKMPDVTIDTMFKKHWFDVEDIYRKAGWYVKFDDPAYNETYEAYYVFTKKK